MHLFTKVKVPLSTRVVALLTNQSNNSIIIIMNHKDSYLSSCGCRVQQCRLQFLVPAGSYLCIKYQSSHAVKGKLAIVNYGYYYGRGGLAVCTLLSQS